MSLVTFYPTSSPFNSTYLPLTERRNYISIIDQVTLELLQGAKRIGDLHKELDIFSKSLTVLAIKNFEETAAFHLGKSPIPDLALKSLPGFKALASSLSDQIKGPIRAKEVYQRISKLTLEWLQNCYSENPLNKTLSPFSFEAEDFEVAGESVTRCVANQRSPKCQDFAFFMLNERAAFPYIFQSADWPREFVTEPIPLLASWGYEMTTKPKAGDLVVYCSVLKGYFEAKHWGIWIGDKKVLSKPGITLPTLAPLEEVILGYGDHVYFFHKQVKSALLEDFLEELEKAKRAIPDFSHPSCYSPWSTLGTALVMAKSLEQMVLTKVFRRSLYNVKYNQKARASILEQIGRFTFKGTKNDALETITEMVRGVSE